MDYVLDSWKQYLKTEPNAKALTDCMGNDLTRNDVDILSDRVNGWLRQRGIGREDMVLISLKRSVTPIVATLGVWKAGAALTIVEADYAKDRVDFIRKNSNAKAEINEAAWADILNTAPAGEYAHPDDHDMCLMVYTSGTTGTPKGVIHEYGQLKWEMLSERYPDGTWRESPKSRWGVVAPLNYVVCMKMIVHFYYRAAHLYVLDYDTIKNPKKLTAYMLMHRIQGIFLSPSILRVKGDDLGPFVKYVYTGSEPADNLFLKNAELGNTYTMSESMFTVCKFIIDKPYPIVPIGTPTFDLKIKLLDENGNKVVPGQTGELCFENPYCRGYVNLPRENERHFIHGFFHTGDLAVFENGMYTLKGRIDDMIKIDGNRIELSEIEAVCKDEMGVSVCVAKGFESDRFVALYYTDNIKPDEQDLRKRLEKRLPYYMIPTYFIHIDKIPLTRSGKTDRKSLTMPSSYCREEYAAPRDTFEEMLCKAFSEVLGVDEVGIKDDFFKLGGNSLMLMTLLSMLDEDELLTPTMVYQGRNIETISELYKKARLTYLTPEQKETEGRRHRYPLSRNAQWYWNVVNDGSLDFYSCYKINGFIPSGFLSRGINRYIVKNSTFNLVLQEGDTGVPVQVYTENTPFVKVERMSEKNARQIIDGFIRPFAFNEPLIRIRILRTPFHSYLLFHAFHLVADGACAHYIIEDMFKCILGKEIKNTNYFCWALEENLRDNSPQIVNNTAFFVERYSPEKYDFCVKTDADTGVTGHAQAHPVKVSLDEVRKYCAKAGISVQTFITAAGILAQAAYNGSSANNLCWNFNNRSPRENHAGVMMRVAFCGVEMDAIHSLKELFDTISKQNEEQLWRLYEYDIYNDISQFIETPVMTITYLEDWFSKAILPSFIGKDVPLVNTSPENPESEKAFVLICTHENDKLCISFSYGRSFMIKEHAEKFADMLDYSMKEIVRGNLPDFTEFK